MISHHSLLRELVFEETDLQDQDLKLFENLWLTCSHIKIFRIRNSSTLKGEFYLKDFFMSILQHLSLDLLDLSRNNLSSSISETLTDVLFTKTQPKLKVLDLRYNKLSAEDNSILFTVFSSSKSATTLNLKLEPFIPGLIQALPSTKIREPQEQEEVEDMLASFRHRREEIEKNALFDSYADHEIEIRVEEDIPEIAVLERQLTFDGEDMMDNHVKSLTLLFEEGESVSLKDLLEASTKFEDRKPQAKSVIPEVLWTKLFEFCLRESKKALESEIYTDWILLTIIADNFGFKRELQSHQEIQQQALTAQAKLYQFKIDLEKFLKLTCKPKEANNLLDSLCSRVLKYGMVGEGVDFLLLIKENRDKTIKKFIDNGIAEFDIQLEMIQNSPLMFLDLNKQLNEETKGNTFESGDYDFLGAHENWLDYERASSLTREQLVSIIEEKLALKGSDKMTLQQTLKFRRSSFILCQPGSFLYEHSMIDTLLVQARLLSRLRWSLGPRSVENYSAIEDFKEKYLEKILEKNLKDEPASLQMINSFIEEKLKPRNTILADENEILFNYRKNLESQVELFIRESNHSSEFDEKVIQVLKKSISSSALPEEVKNHPLTHPFLIDFLENKMFLALLFKAPSRNLVALSWKIKVQIAFQLANTEADEARKYCMRTVVYSTLLEKQDSFIGFDPHTQLVFNSDHQTNHKEIMIELLRLFKSILEREDPKSSTRKSIICRIY